MKHKSEIFTIVPAQVMAYVDEIQCTYMYIIIKKNILLQNENDSK